MKILIVDNKSSEQDSLQTLLTVAGHEVLTTSNGQRACEMVQQEDVRLVIADPDTVGDDVALVRQLRESELPRYTYILLLADSGTSETVRRGLAAGADAFLRVPVQPQELQARIATSEHILGLETFFQVA